MEAQLRTGRAAYNTARAVYLASLPTLAHKVLHLLRRDGRAPQERFLALAGAEAVGRGDAEAVLGGAIRALGEAGKIRRLRSRTTGELYLEATEELDEAAFARSLRRIIHSGHHGIPVPGGRRPAGDSRPCSGSRGTSRPYGAAPRRSSDRFVIPS
jgi:nucleoside-diphosphate-sugar epimerase